MQQTKFFVPSQKDSFSYFQFRAFSIRCLCDAPNHKKNYRFRDEC